MINTSAAFTWGGVNLSLLLLTVWGIVGTNGVGGELETLLSDSQLAIARIPS